MTVRIDIDRYTRKDGTARLFMYYSHGSGETITIPFPTEERINPKDWNKKSHRPKKAGVLSMRLDRERNKVLQIARGIKERTGRNPSPAVVKRAYLSSQHETARTFWQYWGDYLRLTAYKKKANTEKNCQRIEKELRKYETETRQQLHFEDMTLEFYDSFRVYMSPRWKITTYGMYMNYLQGFLNYAYKAEWVDKNPWRGWPSSVQSYAKEDYPLSERLSMQELEALETVDLDLKWSKLRDRLLMHVYTGMRYRDAEPGNFEIIRGVFPVIKYQNNKASKKGGSGKYVSVPLIPKAVEILEFYGWQFPDVGMSHFNVEIKKMLPALGIHKAKASSHMGRKTLSSLLAEHGASDQLRRAVLGHADDRLTQTYVKLQLDPLYDLMLRVFYP